MKTEFVCLICMIKETTGGGDRGGGGDAGGDGGDRVPVACRYLLSSAALRDVVLRWWRSADVSWCSGSGAGGALGSSVARNGGDNRGIGYDDGWVMDGGFGGAGAIVDSAIGAAGSSATSMGTPWADEGSASDGGIGGCNAAGSEVFSTALVTSLGSVPPAMT